MRRTTRTRATRLALAIGLAVSLPAWGCRWTPPPEAEVQREGFIHGWVDIDQTGDIRVSGRTVPAAAPVKANIDHTLRAYRDLVVGVEWRDSKALIVSPIEQRWENFTRIVHVPKGAATASREHIQLTPAPDQPQQFSKPERLMPLDAEISRLTTAYQTVGLGGRPAEEAKSAVATSLKRVVVLATDAASDASNTEQREMLVGIARDAYTSAGTGTMLRYEGGVVRPLQHYRSVLAVSAGTTTIDENGTGKGTGFLIRPNWIVTCRHVVRFPKQPGVYNARFDYAEDESGGIQQPKSCDVKEIHVAKPESTLDLAALRIECGGVSAAELTRRTLKLSDRRAEWGEGLYVVGHPHSGPMRIADNAFVRYPDRVNAEMLDVLKTGLSADPAERQMFDKFYQPCPAEAGLWCYLTPPSRWDLGPSNDPSLPTLGFDSNTFKGNSGSAVFYVKEPRIAGILFGGRIDPDVVKPFAFNRHEGAIPSAAILAWIKSIGAIN